MKKIILFSLLMSISYGKESWLQEQERIAKNKKEREQNQREYDERMENYYKSAEESKRQREIENYNDKKARENREKLENLKTNENEELGTPFLFDGKVVSLSRGNKDYMRINNKGSEFYVLLKDGEASTYSFYIQNQSRVSGGCYNLNSSSYYNCWYTFY